MKFFIFMCCTAHLLTGITSRFHRTTPISSALHSNDDEARQVSKFADMIDFVNSVYNDGRRNVAGRDYDEVSRRLYTGRDVMNHFANLELKRDEDAKEKRRKFKNLSDTVRYQVIDNPEVIEEFKNKQMIKNLKNLSHTGSISSDSKSPSTIENKLKDFRSKTTTIIVTAVPEVILNDYPAVDIKTQNNVQELTTDEPTYRPSVSDDDEPIIAGIELTNDEKEKNNTKADNKDLSIPSKINNTNKFEERSHDNRASDIEYEAKIEKIKKKLETTYNKKKIKDRKTDKEEYSFTKLTQSQETLNGDNERLKDNDVNEKNKEDGNSSENSEKDKNQKEESRDENTRNITSPEKTIFKMHNNMFNKGDWVEEHSIYSQIDRKESNNKHSKKSQEKRDTKNDRSDEKVSQWIKISSQTDNKDILRMKKEEDWDKTYERRSKEEKYRDKNDDRFSKKEKYSDELDERWSKNEKDWDNSDSKWSKNKRYLDKNDDRRSRKKNKQNDKHNSKGKRFDAEYEWNKRHAVYDNYNNENDNQRYTINNERNQKDKDWNERDDEYNKRDKVWAKQHVRWNNKRGSPLREGKKEREMRHGRYKIVDRIDSSEIDGSVI